MFFKRKLFVNIAETLFTAIFSKENIRKNGQKNEKCQNFEKKFSVNSKDMMTWVCLDENMSLRSVLNTLSYSQTYYSYPPPLSTPREKWRFLAHFLLSTKIFAYLVNKCWPNFCHRKKALTFLYKTLTLDFHISLSHENICFENKSLGFQITTFKYCFLTQKFVKITNARSI